MVDSGATHNLVLMTMFEMLKAAVQGISCYYTAESLCISLANNSVILSSKMALIPLPLDKQELQMVDFFCGLEIESSANLWISLAAYPQSKH